MGFPGGWVSLVAQLVKNPPAMWETWVQPLGWEDPLEKGAATHSSILAWRIPWTIPWGYRVRHDWATFTHSHVKINSILWKITIFPKITIFQWFWYSRLLERSWGPDLVNHSGIHGPSHVQLCATLWTVARQAPLFMEFSRPEYQSG